MNKIKEIVVIGGGPAGMLTSILCSGEGRRVHVYERNEKLGKKLFITGKGRCNLTNACDAGELQNSVVTNSKFLYSAFAAFSNQDLMAYMEGLGLKMKVERGNRVFPVSDHSSDVIRTLEKEMKRLGVQVHLNTGIKKIKIEENGRKVLTTEEGTKVFADKLVIATGGLSYPVTGSTGDGLRFARELGLKVTKTAPSLVPMVTEEPYIFQMQGLSLKNVQLTLRQKKKVIYQEFGEMMFTHFGVTGPLILTASAKVGKRLEKGYIEACIDLKPALDQEQLDKRILRDFEENKNKQFKNSLSGLLPAKLIPVVIRLSGISPEISVNSIEKKDRQRLAGLLKNFPFTIVGLRGFDEAIITRGGVSVKEIDPKTMGCKNLPGVYFVGEVLDLDAVTGGFNLQIAWSTAYMAAMAIRQSCEEGEKDEL